MDSKELQQNGVKTFDGILHSFRKGQIIPKRLGVRFFDIPKRARHFLVFGCDVTVEVTNTVCRIFSKGNGYAIFVKPGMAILRNNGTRQKVTVTFSNVHMIGSGVGVGQHHIANTKVN
jgi:hypothetical protein